MQAHCTTQHSACLTESALCSCACPQSKHLAAYDQAEEARCRLRLTAVQCWWESKCDIRAAVALLKQRTPGVRHSNPARFIRIWVAAMEQRFSVATPSSPGRKSTIPAAVAERAVELVWQGYESEGEHRYFRSIQQALSKCSKLAAIRQRYSVSAKTLLRHMAAVEPALRRRRLAVKRLLSEENRLARQEACRRLLLWPAEQLRRVFWIDAATVYVVPKSRLVYAPPHAHMVVTDARLPSHSTNLLKLKFYICINAVAGAVALKFVTGTTDLEGDEEWLVSG